MYPFIKKINNKVFVKLHKDLYDKNLIQKVREKEADSIISFKPQKKYYLLELRVDDFEDYFNFCNYLIDFRQNI